MSDDEFDLEAWLTRIGHDGPRHADLSTLAGVITAQSRAIPFENIDVLLGRPPKLDLDSLQRKLIAGGRGGYCFELNGILGAGLRAMGFTVTDMIGRVIRGLPDDTDAPACHRALRVDLPEGAFLADCGFGNLTPTAPLLMQPGLEQSTPHETMRLTPFRDEMLLQVRLNGDWQNVYRLSPRPALRMDYEVGNWFTATNPGSPFVSNIVLARPGPDGQRITLFNGRVTTRTADGTQRRMLETPDDWHVALSDIFGVRLDGGGLDGILSALEQKGTYGVTHPFFA